MICQYYTKLYARSLDRLWYNGGMERLTIQVGTFEVNCSILSEDGKAWIVDPGNEGERIVDLLAQKGLEPAAILLTHAHFDHIGAIPGLLEKFPDLPVYVHEKDAPMFGASFLSPGCEKLTAL